MGRGWRHADSSPSRGGLDVAVTAGLAVTIVPESALSPGLRVLGPEQGYPALPAIEILLYRSAGAGSASVAMLAEVIVETLDEACPDAA